MYTWEWSTGRHGDQGRRPGLPWIGVFLLVLGGLLALFGAVNLIQPQVGGFIIPIVLVVGGAVLVLGSMMAPGRTWRFPR